MPIAKFKCVREVSSEDPNFTAENLIKEEAGKKWKTKNAGEKSAYIIFELEKPVQISGIDIGNDHSAFVEVLVSASGCRSEDFTEILITCSFMTPIESKNSSNPNRVRCFNKDALVAQAATEKWHLVKILCTQPFNKHVQYGLSFIKLHTVDIDVSKKDHNQKTLVPERFLTQINKTKAEENIKDREKTKKVIAKFALREESPDSDSESSAALFSRWKKSRGCENLPTTAAAIRQASTVSNLKKITEGVKTSLAVVQKSSVGDNQHSEIPDRNRKDLSFGADEDISVADKKLQRLSKHIEAEKALLKAQRESSKKVETKVRKSEEPLKHFDDTRNGTKQQRKRSSLDESTELSSSRKRISSPSGGPSKKLKSEPTLKYRPFNQLLSGVVLVISGIQNPDRANLRSKALAMGAKYKADWETGCTHLICAFKNTPKYNQVKNKGKIVKRAWIEKCFDLKKYLPWRRYALDSDEEAKPESDTEILDDALKPLEQREPGKRSCRSEEADENNSIVLESGSDTDDEIERVMQKNSKKKETPPKNRDDYDVTTEEEEYIPQKSTKMKASLNFFDGLKFIIASDLLQGERDQIEKCIKHYGGYVTQKGSEADVFIAENLSATCELENFNGSYVQPQWIFECNDKEQKVPMGPYTIIADNKNTF